MGNAQHTAGKKPGLTETGQVSTIIFFFNENGCLKSA